MNPTTKKILIIGGLGAVGYLVYQHLNASGQIAQLAGSTNPANNGTADQVVTPGAVAATGFNQPAGGEPDTSQLSAMLAWSNQTKNPTLYAQWIEQLDAADLNQLYIILTTSWNVGVPPTTSETSWWNNQVSMFPFLRAPNQAANCTNLMCT